jgi:hypothetical protein
VLSCIGEARKCLRHAERLVGEENFKKFRSRGWNIVCQLSNVDDIWKRKGQGMNAFEEIRTSTHERVSQPVEVGSVLHLLCENINWLVFATDMRDRNGPLINPFTRDVLFQLDVTIAF